MADACPLALRGAHRRRCGCGTSCASFTFRACQSRASTRRETRAVSGDFEIDRRHGSLRFTKTPLCRGPLVVSRHALVREPLLASQRDADPRGHVGDARVDKQLESDQRVLEDDDEQQLVERREGRVEALEPVGGVNEDTCRDDGPRLQAESSAEIG